MAVYTDVSFEDLERLLEQYDIGLPLSFKGIAEGIENSNFYLQTDRGAFILTLYEKRVAAEDLPFFLGLMDHLSARGIHCPLPVRTRDGRTLVTLNGRHAAIVTFLTGIALRRPDAAHCAGASAVLARLHQAGEGFALTRANALGPKGWRPLFESIAGADAIEDGMTALMRSALDELERNWPAGLPSGVIHADYFPDNVLFVQDAVGGVIDFYFACNDAYIYDLAIMLNSWCFELDGSFNITKGQAVINAYRATRPLSEAEIDALPTLMRGSALRFLLTRTYDWINHDPEALVRPKDPREYSKKLRFHNKVRHAREYGLSMADLARADISHG
ncbi:MAG TPA: homoserine kinase [Rhizomicrobium sp.]|jgi:homoserine kinase type II|nr:homoserine kinase [Rhizomicrobium sp.]